MKELSKKSISFQKVLMGDKKVHRFHNILSAVIAQLPKFRSKILRRTLACIKEYTKLQCLKVSVVLLKSVF